MKKNYYKSDLWKSFWHFKLFNLSPGLKSVHVRVLIVCPSLFSSSIALLFRPFFSRPALFSLSSTERFRSFSVSTMAHRIISCVIINLLDLFFFYFGRYRHSFFWKWKYGCRLNGYYIGLFSLFFNCYSTRANKQFGSSYF